MLFDKYNLIWSLKGVYKMKTEKKRNLEKLKR